MLCACSDGNVRLCDDDQGTDKTEWGRPAKVRRVDSGYSIEDMPPEILVMILNLVSDGASFVACRMASRLFWTYSPVDFAVAHVSPQALIASRVPPDIARAVFARRGDTPCWFMLPLAADTGSIRTVEWVSRLLCDFHAPNSQLCIGSGDNVLDDDDDNRQEALQDDDGDDDDDDGTLEHLADFVYHRPLMVRRSALKDDPFDLWGCFRTHVDEAAYIAARAGTVDIIAHLHETFRKPGPECGCSPSVGKVAFHAARHGVLEWLADVGCDGRYRPGCMSVQDAVNKGNPALVEWTVRVAKPWHRFVTWPMVHTLAVRNNVPMMDLVARLGLYPLSSDDMAIAAGAGSLDVVRWAAGEAIEGVVGAHDGPRVAEWCSTKVARTAAKRGRIEIVQWLLNHPHATHFVGASAAQRALAKGHYEIVRLLGEAGRADFGRWDALFQAVSSGNLDMLSFVADNGGIYRPNVLAAALEGRHAGIVGYLCDKYTPSYADMIEAIHTANQTYDTETTDLTVDWLVEHVSAAASLQPMLQRSHPKE